VRFVCTLKFENATCDIINALIDSIEILQGLGQRERESPKEISTLEYLL
jgi:hypothetical protein